MRLPPIPPDSKFLGEIYFQGELSMVYFATPEAETIISLGDGTPAEWRFIVAAVAYQEWSDELDRVELAGYANAEGFKDWDAWGKKHGRPIRAAEDAKQAWYEWGRETGKEHDNEPSADTAE